MIPCTARPAPPPELVEAPPEIVQLFRAWWDAPLGQRSGPLHDLTVAMWSHRNTWFLVGEQIMYIRKNDAIRVLGRTIPLGPAGGDS
jgi:hypothetical protein